MALHFPEIPASHISAIDDIQVRIGPLDDRWVALCYEMLQPKIILMDTQVWEGDKAERFQVFLHEIGHCAFGMDHNNTKLKIMNSNQLDKSEFLNHYSDLIDDFFFDVSLKYVSQRKDHE